MVSKNKLHACILLELESLLNRTVSAAQQAYETATNKQNKAENKYDTLGLEAAYLAEGQSKRVAQYETEVEVFKKFPVKEYIEGARIGVGALVSIVNEQKIEDRLFIGPVAGGLCFSYSENGEQFDIRLVTPASPIGKALIGLEAGDEFTLTVKGKALTHEILTVI